MILLPEVSQTVKKGGSESHSLIPLDGFAASAGAPAAPPCVSNETRGLMTVIGLGRLSARPGSPGLARDQAHVRPIGVGPLVSIYHAI